MHEFLIALSHLLLRSLHNTVGWMGTTLLAVTAAIVNQFVVPWVEHVFDKEKFEKKALLKRVRASAIVAVVIWVLIYGANVVYTIHDHHRFVVASNHQLIAKLLSEDAKLSQLNVSLQQDEEKIKTLTVPETKDSLRRRTIRTADELRAYLIKRAETQPPFAAPNSSDPNPSEETKKAIETWRRYSQETEDHYAKHFRDRMVGIAKEYESRGVPTRYLENDFRQRVPGAMAIGSDWEGSPMDELGQFRALAYRVDARDHLIVF